MGVFTDLKKHTIKQHKVVYVLQEMVLFWL